MRLVSGFQLCSQRKRRANRRRRRWPSPIAFPHARPLHTHIYNMWRHVSAGSLYVRSSENCSTPTLGLQKVKTEQSLCSSKLDIRLYAMPQDTCKLSMSQGQQVFILTARNFLLCDMLDATQRRFLRTSEYKTYRGDHNRGIVILNGGSCTSTVEPVFQESTSCPLIVAVPTLSSFMMRRMPR